MEPLPVLDVRFIVVSDKEAHEFRLQRNALRYLRKCAETSGANYRVEFDASTQRVDSLDEAVALVKARIKLRQFGERVSIIASHLGKTLNRATIHVAAVTVKPADIPGTPQTKQWGGYVKEFWPNARFAGSVVCKPDSDHPLGAALDHFDTWEHMRQSHEFAIANAEEVHTKYSILGDEIWTAGPPWTNSSRGRHDYTGDFHAHQHWSGRDGKCGVFCTPGYGACS